MKLDIRRNESVINFLGWKVYSLRWIKIHIYRWTLKFDMCGWGTSRNGNDSKIYGRKKAERYHREKKSKNQSILMKTQYFTASYGRAGGRMGVHKLFTAKTGRREVVSLKNENLYTDI